MYTTLLINEPPLQALPSLACELGINAAIILQQVHYWLSNPKVGAEMDGKRWIYNSVREWQENNFPWLTEDSVGRIIRKLEEDGYLESACYNSNPLDMTKWYTINYDRLNELARRQNKGIVAKSSNHSGKIQQPIPETTSIDRNTTYSPGPENKPKPAKPSKPKPPAKEGGKEKLNVPPELIDLFCQKTKVYRPNPGETITWGKFTDRWLKPLWFIYHVLCADNLNESKLLVAAAVDELIDRPNPLDINSPGSIENPAISIKAQWNREGRKGGRIDYR